jgi:hypothetical protein
MMKAHCDNCGALIVDANPKRLVTIQPRGFQCVVIVTVRDTKDVELCASCLHAAALAFAEHLGREHRFVPAGATPSEQGAPESAPTIGVTDLTGGTYKSLDVVATEGGKATVEHPK